jgi:endo-1,4-beta-D-glucanase Y
MTHRRRRQSHLLSAVTGVALGAAALTQTSLGHAQTFPFPSTNITNGRTTGVLTSHELRSLYNFWRTTFVQTCNEGGRRVRYPESGDDTRSEAVGYGMVIAAYMGDQPTFDGLWDYYQRFQQNGLMRWKTNGCANSNDNGSAADADIDAAFGLIVANRQWPNGGYGGDADTILDAIRAQLFDGACQGILLAGSDANFSNCGCTNPSYSAPAYYRAFAAADTGQAAFWNAARTATYGYLAAAQNDTTGLVPAWANSGGGTGLTNCQPQVSGGGSPAQFQADAARTPWRVATDFVWTGNAQASAFLNPMAGFASSTPNRIVQIVDVYSLQGQPLGLNGTGNLAAATLDATGRRSTFTMGGFATAMTASSQENLDRFTGAWQSMYLPGDSVDGNHAFNTSLALLYGLLVTGYMWDPTAGAANPAPVPEPTLVPEPGNLLTNGDFDEGFRGWTIENFGAGASEAFAMHQAGELTVSIQENQAAEPWNIPLYQSVNVTQARNYLISFKARSTEARPIRVIVENPNDPTTPLGQLINRFDANAELQTIGTEMATYETVFTAPATVTGARFSFQLGNSLAPVTLDDVIFTETDRAPSFRGELAGQAPPVAGGQGGAGGNDGQTGGEAGGLGAAAGPTIPPGEGGGPTPNPDGQTGQPAAPGTIPGAANGAPRSAATCAPYAYSDVLKLCYDQNTGYVFDDAQNRWAQPFVTPACAPYVFWPKLPPNGACYDPATGYGYNAAACIPGNPQSCWVYVGANFTIDTGADDSGCSINRASSGRSAALGLSGLAGLFLLGSISRRRAARR